MNINTWNYPLKTENQHNNVQKLLVTNNSNSPTYLNGAV